MKKSSGRKINRTFNLYTAPYDKNIRKMCFSGSIVMEHDGDVPGAKAEYLPTEKIYPPFKTTAYDYYKIKQNAGPRVDVVAQRIIWWCKQHNITKVRNGVTIVDIPTLQKYINAYAAQWGYSLSYSLLYSYLNRICTPKADRLAIISEALGVSDAWLAGYGAREIQTRVDYELLRAIENEKKTRRRGRPHTDKPWDLAA